MTAARGVRPEPDGDFPELNSSEAKQHFGEVLEYVRDGGTTYITRYGRRIAAIVPADVAEAQERAEDAYLSALVDEAKSDREPRLSTAELMRELGLA